MKHSEVSIGGLYLTRICGHLSKVAVVRETLYGGRRCFVVMNVGSGRELPKPRTAAALRVVGLSDSEEMIGSGANRD